MSKHSFILGFILLCWSASEHIFDFWKNIFRTCLFHSLSMAGEETWWQLHKNVESNIEQVLATTPHETPTVRPPASHHENYTGQTSQTRRTLLEKQRRAHKWRTTMDPHIWPSKSRTTSPNLHTAAMWGHRM